MTTEIEKEADSPEKEITFKCKFCEQSKPFADMIVLNRFFPQLIACKSCEKKMR